MRGATAGTPQRVTQFYNFYSHTSCEVRPATTSITLITMSFLLTHLMRGATEEVPAYNHIVNISTHTPHARCDIVQNAVIGTLTEFLLTHLMRGAT